MLEAVAGVSRAPFLLLPFTLVAVGAAGAAYDGAFDPARTLLALVGLVALQVAVNTLNEVSDFLSGIDLETERTPFSGGSGTLPEGRMSVAAAKLTAAVAVAVAVVIGLWFLRVIGGKLLPILALGALASFAYSGVLARAYLGELFAGLGLGALPVLGTALVQEGELGPVAVAAALPPFFMTFNLLLLNEFPDEEADRRGGRRNLVRLCGRRGAALVYALAALAVPAALAAAVALGLLPTLCLAAMLPSLLLFGPLRWALGEPSQPVPVGAMGANVAWNLLTNAVLAATLWLAGPAGG